MTLSIPCVILGGGRAARMGGGDKGLRKLKGRPLLTHVAARLAPQADPLAINANGDPARFSGFGLPVVADSIADHPGPLAGILAAMDWAAARGFAQVATAASDTPFLPDDLVARLMEAAGPSGLAVAETRDKQGARRRHPTAGLWPVYLREDLRAFMMAGERKAGLWIERHNAATAVWDAGAPDPFFNVNTPDDLAAAESWMAGGDV